MFFAVWAFFAALHFTNMVEREQQFAYSIRSRFARDNLNFHYSSLPLPDFGIKASRFEFNVQRKFKRFGSEGKVYPSLS